jgi:hypothetical protein
VTEPLTIAFISATSSILGSLMVIFLTQPVQHLFWKRQRHGDLRFTVANKVNELAGGFAVNYLVGKDWPEEPFSEGMQQRYAVMAISSPCPAIY